MSAVQGTIEWLQEKLGIISASNFSRLMTNGKGGGLSVGALTYCDELACDIVYGRPEEDTATSADMHRGTELEPIARRRFEEVMTARNPLEPMQVTEVGFIKHPSHEYYGASLDGKTNDGGSIEMKCRRRKGHLNQLKELKAEKLDKKVTYQMQWGMYVADLSHCYFIGYTDELPEGEGDVIIKKFERDEDMIAEMEAKAVLAVIEIKLRVINYRELIKEYS